MAGREEYKKTSLFNNTCAVWWLLSHVEGWRIFMRYTQNTKVQTWVLHNIIIYNASRAWYNIMWLIVEFPGDIIPLGKQCYWKLGYAHSRYYARIVLYLVIDTYVLYIYCSWEEYKGNTGENNTYYIIW